jgi:hypothetical protein
MIQLNENWTDSWKWLQTQLGALIFAAPVLYQTAPQLFQPYVSANVFNWGMAVLGALIVLNSFRAK